eukprot:TRINITY_DN26046_c0_g1_i1.p1 TRINITY_DN26046_c0_g1~~TRINITY_DN26046_c0_g1_i1.p1  ORF type:complete len:755 (+),score=226.07 TRINITY_DN26046_c0_g1_i1:39-2267(+)
MASRGAAMNASHLSSIGIPFGGDPVCLVLPEERSEPAAASSSASAPAAAKAKAKPQAAPAPGAAPQGGAAAPPAGKAPGGAAPSGKNFLEKWIDADLEKGGRCHGKKIMTRFPPEPNGYLHIGHAKAILTNFGLAQKYNGQCNLRFDDTNPETEEVEYVESIKEDVCWITKALNLEQCKNGGKPWREGLFFASDYFEQMHAFAIDLIKQGKAYVDSQTPEEVQKNRGGGEQNLPGVDSPFRNRSVEENLRLFAEMQEGKHPEGSLLLRAKIDMQHPNMNLRDPPMYRIRYAKHHRAGDRWKVYPIYDFAHGNEDAIEGVTHSICTLEFENHNALYRWFIENISTIPHQPMQKEFARLEVEGAVTSKRKLLRLVKEKKVEGWDDPRLLTVCGIRRRGVRPEGILKLCETVGVTNSNSTTPWEVVEDCWREDLENVSKRRLAVLEPLPVEITTYGSGTEYIPDLTDLPNQSPDDKSCTREIAFSSEIFIERSDYMENAPEGYFRLSKIGSEVKLRYAYVIKLEEVVKDKAGNVVKLKCSHDPETRDIMPADRKPKVIHWVNAKDSLDAEVRLINMLFHPMPSTMPAGKDFMDYLNPEAWVVRKAKVEKALKDVKQEDRFQFERCGYFAPDYDTFEKKGKQQRLVFNRVVSLKESSGKKKMEGNTGASRKEAQAAAQAEKERLQKIPPEEFFKSERAAEFSAYDAAGLPTHDKDGAALPKSRVKKLQGELDKHKKLHEAWKKASA